MNIRRGASLQTAARCTAETLEGATDSGIAKQVSAMLSLWTGHALFTVSELGLANMQVYAKHLCKYTYIYIYIYIYTCIYIYIYIQLPSAYPPPCPGIDSIKVHMYWLIEGTCIGSMCKD